MNNNRLVIQIRKNIGPKDVASVPAFRKAHYGTALPKSKEAIVRAVRRTFEEFGESVNDEIGSVSGEALAVARAVVLKHFPEWRKELA